MTEEARKLAREARERAEKAAEGPWGTPTQPNVVRPLPMGEPLTIAAFRRDEDAAFVACARSDVPALCDHVEALSKEVDKQRQMAHERYEEMCESNVRADGLSERVDELEEALRFYADPNNWEWTSAAQADTCIERDDGERARAALSGGEG